MAEARVHVVGAGLAGLSAAVRLTERGWRVVLHEANPFPGGRCRSFRDPRLDRVIDNGNHLILSGNRSAMAYLDAIGARRRLTALPARFPFVDLATGARWAAEVTKGPVPWWIASPARRIPGTRMTDYLAGLRLAIAGHDKTVAEALPSRGAIWTRFWEPLTLAAINTTPDRAAAALLWPVLRETFGRGAAYARPMVAPEGLGSALVEPAVDWLTARGAAFRLGRQLRQVRAEDGRARALEFADSTEPVAPSERVVLALPPTRLRAVLPHADPPDDACTIVNAFFRVAGPLPASVPPFLGILSSTAHWVFRRGDVLSVTVSAADALGVAESDGNELIPRIWDEVRQALGLGVQATYLSARLNKERRATFDQSPAGLTKRLQPHTALANLFLAGDATATGLPATIEGAIRSGETVAAIIGGPGQ